VSTTPRVTVITPARDVGPWIGEAVDSVLAQTEHAVEYLVVDDGSTDDTAEVVRRRAATDPRLSLVTGDGAGSGAARNRGLELARAPFVAFLDGDDRWHPRFLERQLAAFSRVPRDVGAVFCHTRVMLEGGQVVALRVQATGACDLDRLLAENCPPHNGSSLLLRRSCFEEAGHFDTQLPSAVDFEMWLRIASRSSTPLFWGQRRYLLDMRLDRAGAISGDRAARFAALETILNRFTPEMSRLPSGLAHVRPAVFAYRDGFDDIGDRWAAPALAVGSRPLLRDRWGRELLAWHHAGPTGRPWLRRGRHHARSGAYRGLATVRRLAA
jgi:glycosyltransferase involved in cell wall biosynthesis